MNQEASKKKEYEARKAAREQEQRAVGKKKMVRQWAGFVLLLGGIGIIIALIGWFFLSSSIGGFSIDSTCVNHSPRLAMHIHPRVQIRINGEDQKIPAGVGVSPACMKTIHTHDADNVLHLEAPVRRDFTLGEFFHVWEKPFSRTQILDAVLDEQHEIVLTVNGQPSDAYENLVLNDKDAVVIEYREKTPSVPAPTE